VVTQNDWVGTNPASTNYSGENYVRRKNRIAQKYQKEI